jgi:putative nucleotidyltransferase with HDIG domain
MFNEKGISVFDFVVAISEMVDLTSPALKNHNNRVAYISYCLADTMGLSIPETREVVLAAMLHDIGMFSTAERQAAHMPNSRAITDDDIKHANVGYKLLRSFEPLAEVALIVKHHHAVFNKEDDSLPIGSYIISLADDMTTMLDENEEILAQIPGAIEGLGENELLYHPDVFEALKKNAKLECVWVEAFSPSFSDAALRYLSFPEDIAGLDMLLGFAKVVAHIIDFRSRFTATHSSGIAAVARELASLSGYSEKECKKMEIAGYIHDIGKLSVPNEILEKNGKLDPAEFNVIRKHTYYTYAILRKIDALEHIAAWAAFHHERIDGNGYPFHIEGKDIARLARIMAISDVFTALTEDRPYREGLDREKTMKILFSMADGALDRSIVELLDKNYDRVNDIRAKAQSEALEEYHSIND